MHPYLLGSDPLLLWQNGLVGAHADGLRQSVHSLLVDVGGQASERLLCDVVLAHQTLQRRAVAMIVVFLKRTRRKPVEAEQLRHEQRDPRVDLRPDTRLVRIQRVVEVEHPGVDMGEIAFGSEGNRMLVQGGPGSDVPPPEAEPLDGPVRLHDNG